MFTTVLIGPPGGLAEDGVEALRRALSGTATRWLAPGRAAEFDHGRAWAVRRHAPRWPRRAAMSRPCRRRTGASAC
jgi:hypothetical protein